MDALASGLLVGAVFGGLAFIVGQLILRIRKAREERREQEPFAWPTQKVEHLKSIVKSSITNAADTFVGTDFSLKEADPEFFAVAHAEIGTDQLKKGLWAKALVVADADEKKQQVHYIKLRVQQKEQKLKDTAEKALREKIKKEQEINAAAAVTLRKRIEKEQQESLRAEAEREYWSGTRSILASLMIIALVVFLIQLSV